MHPGTEVHGQGARGYLHQGRYARSPLQREDGQVPDGVHMRWNARKGEMQEGDDHSRCDLCRSVVHLQGSAHVYGHRRGPDLHEDCAAWQRLQ